MKIGKFVSKYSKMILIISTILLVPAVLGFMASDINYDILSYLPQDIGSTKGQDILDKKFNSAATSMLILEDKTEFEVDEIKEKIAEVKGVNDVISRSSLVPNMVPKSTGEIGTKIKISKFGAKIVPTPI
ncbi:hypothetical protein HMPREF9709_01456 [Helcococcus kunzii ATCC 51366]|uniref:Membrane transport protein MMPL domain-containing protein n=1 Tax=Helcococcus kunzii ATCC 51366 TaxID=883114 RepID=H3NQ45_9FIRM|nr:hypothetical protein [Helcococcus kunzii]EHR32525.1 hypothetical protein HMPREF9709_01456 [Helcococcus kunzii ATCC 51366]MCT1796355.1 hypothetical protein [Helcococcus kunzii]MCT1989405.1 hypothetical protein [Helcococcus kunzii]